VVAALGLLHFAFPVSRRLGSSFSQVSSIGYPGAAKPPPLTACHSSTSCRAMAQLVEQIRAARRPYVFVSEIYSDVIIGNWPDLDSVLENDYEVLKTSDIGTWFELS
jgi:hypothetical protein